MTDLLDQLKSALADRYTIERELGSGGMAVVYLARDQKLRRNVALKVLRPDLAASLGAERFLREIEIAANLTHPNILALYDSGRAAVPPLRDPERGTGGEAFLYYVMPYVEGESLRDRLNREKQLPIDDALQITKEVADALGHAHSLGIIHRDIKPENILFTAGHAVVADFGIARAVSEAGAATLTETGLAIGTPAYMSPEQATGTKEIDARSDLYSLGCVLYEMLSGDAPHVASTPQAVIAKKLSEPTPRVSVVRERVPMSVQAALDTVLAKTPADRYATAQQFTEALHAAGVAVPSEAHPAPTVPARRRWLVPGVGGAVVLVGIAVVLVRLMGSGPISITTSDARPVSTERGLEFQPAISPDGSWVAYIAGLEGRIVVRSAIDGGTGGGSRPGDEAGGFQWFPSWKPDGASVRFMICIKPVSDCEWKQVGTLGGAPRTISVPRESAVYAWSPDGTRAVFGVRDRIYVSSQEGGEPKLLGVHTVDPLEPHSFAWSSDGQRIAYVNRNYQWRHIINVDNASIWVLDANGGDPMPVTDEENLNVSPQWLPDSRHLLFISDRDGQREVYVVDVGPDGPRGEPQKVAGPADPHSISISRDGRRLAYSKFPLSQNIWSIPIAQSGSISIRDAVQVTTDNQLVESHSVSPDGEWIVFDAYRRGESDIYKMRLGEGGQHLVADIPGIEYAPVWSPDGTEIAYHSGTGPTGNDIKVVSADGGTPEQVTDFPGQDGDPDWSPDGLAIAFHSQHETPWSIWIVSRERVGIPWGQPVQLTDFACAYPKWTPDGESLLCRWRREWLRVSREGKVISRTAMPSAIAVHSYKLSRDGLRIYFSGIDDNLTQGIWWVPIAGGDATNVVSFDDDATKSMKEFLSLGPEHLYFTVADQESDIWVIDLEW